MSNNFGFLSDDTFAEKMDIQNQFLAGILAAQGGSVKPTKWTDVQALVRSGLASKVFHVADQFVISKGSKDLIATVIGVDHDEPADPQYNHSLTLQFQDSVGSYQYGSYQAFYYCENELPAGTYNIVLGFNWGTHVHKDRSYQFTLTKSIPAGGQICGLYRSPDVTPSSWTVDTYASNKSTDKIDSNVAVTEGNGGTSLGTLGEKIVGNMNSMYRSSYGSNNYADSALRQLINSEANAGDIWVPKTKFDRPPSYASTVNGFLSDLDPEFLAVVGKTKKIVGRQSVTDDGGVDILADKFFLLSEEEVYMPAPFSDRTEGEVYPYYKDYSELASPSAGADPNRIKYSNGSPIYWWLRTPVPWNAYDARLVGPSGAVSSNGAIYGCGVVPACNII